MAKIVVLDDVVDAGVLIKKILERKDHEVHPFIVEEEAIDFLKENKVDLVILDMKLKKMTGIEVLEEIKKFDSGIRVMMLTGYPTIGTAKEALSLGAEEYCVKPIDKEELEEKVAAILGRDTFIP